MSLQNDIQEIELSIEDAKNIAAFGAAISRLEKNADFRTVFIEGYFRDEASRLTLLTAEPNITEEHRQATMGSIRAIGELHQFLTIRKNAAERMNYELKTYQDTLDELRVEEANEEGEA